MDRMDRQQLLEELTQETADRNHAYQQSLKIIQRARRVRPVNRYRGYGIAFSVALTSILFSVAEAEADGLLRQAAYHINIYWHWFFGSQT